MSFRCRAVAFLVGTTWLRVSRRESLVISSRKTVPIFGIRVLAAVLNDAYFTPTSTPGISGSVKVVGAVQRISHQHRCHAQRAAALNRPPLRRVPSMPG